MTTARSFHTATILPDETVLVAGGCTSYGPTGVCAAATSSAEIFDPSRNAWRKGSDMKEARQGHTATSLPDGRVLVAGGCRVPISGGLLDCKELSPTAEIYDPKKRRWSQGGSMKVGRVYHTAALITGPTEACGQNCGKVFVLGNTARILPGGRASLLMEGAAPELFDPKTGTWAATSETPASSMRSSVGDCCTPTATPVNGRVLLTGIHESALVFSPKDATWKRTATPGLLNYASSATAMKDGSVLVAGGFSFERGRAKTASAEKYVPDAADPSSGSWRPAPRMSVERSAHQTKLFKDGSVLVIGGGQSATPASPSPVASEIPLLQKTAEFFRPTAASWEPAGEMKDGRGDDQFFQNFRPPDFTAAVLGDGRVLVAGGAVPTSGTIGLPGQVKKAPLKLAELYVPANWQPVRPPVNKESSSPASGIPVGVIAGSAGGLLLLALLGWKVVRTR